MSSDSGSLSPTAPNVSSSAGGSGHIIFIVIAMFLVLALFIGFFYIQTVIGNCLGRLLSSVSAGVAAATGNHNQSRNLGLELEQISCLPTFTYQPIKKICRNKGHEHNEKVSTVECSVCLGDLEEGETVRVLPACKHYFHVKCIDMWLSTRASCPICRAHPEPEKVQQGLVSASPPWHLMYSSSLERQQFRIGSCLSSPFSKTPRHHKSPSPLGTSPFHGSWIGSPSMSTPPWELHQILVEARTPDVLEMRQIS